MKRKNLRRKKASKEIGNLPQTKILPQKENLKATKRKIQGLPTTGLRRSTRLNTMKEATLEAVEHIDLEPREKSKGLENSPRESLRLSPRVSPPPFSSPPRSLIQSLGIDLVQQEIYDYIESLERKEATAKG